MEQNRQCPRCGKYVAADRTYCMSCGVTLGIKCPDCHAVMPVGAKTCTGCGHSFVEKKKLNFRFPLWGWMKKWAHFIVPSALVLLLFFSLIAAAFPVVSLSVYEEETPALEHTLSGFDLMGYFLGGHPYNVDDLLEMEELSKSLPGVKAYLFGMGLGQLTLLFGLIFSLILLAPNLMRLGKATARRLYAPFGIALGGAVLSCGLSIPLSLLLKDEFIRYTDLAEESFRVYTLTLMPYCLILVGLAVLALHLILHLAVFRKKETAEEWSLGRTLLVPVKGAMQITRIALDFLARKKGEKPRRRAEPAFAVTPRFTYYLILLGVALVFTQALLSKVSNIFFWFILLIPFIMLGYVLLAAKALTVKMGSDTTTTEKNTPYTYGFRIGNRLPLAIPFVEACVSIPQSNSVRCTERTVRLSMAPLSGYNMTNTVSFRYRGTYDIGVKYFYVYDFFRMFRMRVDMDEFSTVYVLPRRMNLGETGAHSVSDDTARTVKSPLVVDRLEISDIREYQNGDPLKSIHWKLSSKSETFIVKDYNTGTSNQTVIFCDLTPHYPDEPPKAGEEEAGEASVSKKAKKAQRKAVKAQKKAEAASKAGKKKKSKKKGTDAPLPEAVLAEAETLSAVDTEADAAPVVESKAPEVNVHELASPLYYEDMNEYLADGVVEITIASVLAELRRGHEVLLIWYDRRSEAGVFAYPLRDVDQFERVYHLFATAPLCAPDKKVTALTAMVSDIQSTKQMFMLSTLDAAMLSDLTAMPGISDAESFGSAEVLLYDPSPRFRYPKERALYLNGCREQLATSGLSLSAGTFHLNSSEGGIPHETA